MRPRSSTSAASGVLAFLDRSTLRALRTVASVALSASLAVQYFAARSMPCLRVSSALGGVAAGALGALGAAALEVFVPGFGAVLAAVVLVSLMVTCPFVLVPGVSGLRTHQRVADES